MSKIRIKDKVRVLSGRDKGKEGEVVKVFPSRGKIVVSGSGMVKRHLKQREGQRGGIVSIERPIAISKVGVICKSCKKATRVGFKIEGKIKSRICLSCEALI